MALDANSPMVLEELTEIIDIHLTALRFFPGGAGSLAVARLLAELVNSVDEARQLCRTIVEDYDEWPGPATVRRLYLEQFRKSPIWQPPPRPIKCVACQDWGCVRGPEGNWQACACFPEFPTEILDLMNRPPAPALRGRIGTWSAPNPAGDTRLTSFCWGAKPPAKNQRRNHVLNQTDLD